MKEGVSLKVNLRSSVNDKILCVFLDAGYIAFTVPANRLGVFMEDLLASYFIEGFVSFYLFNRS